MASTSERVVTKNIKIGPCATRLIFYEKTVRATVVDNGDVGVLKRIIGDKKVRI